MFRYAPSKQEPYPAWLLNKVFLKYMSYPKYQILETTNSGFQAFNLPYHQIAIRLRS